jgi:hypothetical protein
MLNPSVVQRRGVLNLLCEEADPEQLVCSVAQMIRMSP